MTKPQFSGEPSMEDILASIRKMISEERMGPRPIPDQIGRSPFGESIADAPAAISDPRFDRTSAPERAQPSFSSLSDALKAAAPTFEPRRSLEDKIADMLANGEVAPRPSPTDALAVFSGTRPTPATSLDPGSLSAPTRAANLDLGRKSPGATDAARTAKPAPRAPEAPFNGAQRREDSTPRSAAPSMPKTAGTSSPEPKIEPKIADSKSPGAKKDDTIIAMPPRPGAAAANGAGQPSVSSPAAAGMNGAHAVNGAGAASTGLHSLSGAASQRAPLREPDASKGANGVAAKPANGLDAKAGEGSLGGRTLDDPTKSAKEQRPSRNEPGKPLGASSSAAVARASDAEKSPVSAQDGLASSVTNKSGPSEALLDAVVALVHKEPDSLSVFTSGSAFIHGVTADEPAKPGPNMGRKLDRSAAELLRPMLRQWLAENMPRIVEEALRSELMSSQPAPKDSSKA